MNLSLVSPFVYLASEKYQLKIYLKGLMWIYNLR